MATVSSNGDAPTREGTRLVRKNYSERVLANLGTQRLITDGWMRQFGEFNPDRVGIADLRRMRRDTMIKMGLYYSKAPQVRAEYTVKCEDLQIQAAMEEIVGKVRQSWMRTALNKNDFGYQGAIKDYRLGRVDATYENEQGEVVPVWNDPDVQPVILGRPVSIPPEHARVALKDGQYDGINTTMRPTSASSNEDDNKIPAEWSLWFVNEFEEEFGNYYGVSRILPCYESWYAYWFTHHMRSRHVEMDADPALQVWYPPGTWVDPTDLDETGQPKRKSNRDAALEVGAMLRGGATIAWPSDVYVDEQGKSTPIALWRAEFLKGGENVGAFNEVLNDLDIQKLRGCLVPEEALVAHTGGLNSGGRAKSYGQIFNESLEMEAVYLDEIWNDYQIRPIVEANWGKDAPPCTLKTTGFQEDDMTLWGELVKLAFQLDPNALPVKFEDILDTLGIPQYTAKEQADREQAAADAAQQAAEVQAADAAAAAGAEVSPGAAGGATGGQVGALPGENPQQLAASQDGRRRGPRKYEREVIHLSSGRAPRWAHKEGERREKNITALADRLKDVVRARYEDVFEAAADAVVGLDDVLMLGVADRVKDAINYVTGAIKEKVSGYLFGLTGEMASLYHASGMSELHRMGLSGESWDVGRDEVQEWARWRAGELIKTIDKTVVEQHVRPFLTRELQNLGLQQADGIPYGTLELAQRMSDHFAGYPEWMAERVVRTEAMKGYNLSAADMWERVGVTEVEEYDGLGGRTGKTDAHCLARNGNRVTIDEFRDDVEEEHPNGTLGAVPVVVGVELHPIQPGILVSEPALSASVYGVTTDGLILSQIEVGEALAGA